MLPGEEIILDEVPYPYCNIKWQQCLLSSLYMYILWKLGKSIVFWIFVNFQALVVLSSIEWSVKKYAYNKKE